MEIVDGFYLAEEINCAFVDSQKHAKINYLESLGSVDLQICCYILGSPYFLESSFFLDTCLHGYVLWLCSLEFDVLVLNDGYDSCDVCLLDLVLKFALACMVMAKGS